MWYHMSSREERAVGSQDTITKFMSLFVGNSRSFGRFIPAEGNTKEPRMLTMKEAYGYSNFESHLSGEIGLGLVPILDDGSCKFGVLDIDAHGKNDKPIPIEPIVNVIAENKLPLTVCRSKSGRGLHLYCFAAEPIPAKTMISALARWSEMIGHGGCEIFPKQERLLDGALGNWINLPYFGGARTAIEGGVDVDVDYFIEAATSRLVTEQSLEELAAGDEFAEAPPCLQRLVSKPIPEGENIRNNALLLASLFYKKAYPDNWQNRAFDFNNKFMETPLTHSEAKKTIASAGQKDYKYKCKEEPCASLCNRPVCITRKYGVSPGQGMSKGDLPRITRVVRHFSADSDEVKWEVTIDGSTIYMTSAELCSQHMARAKIMNVTKQAVPPVKAEVWYEFINEHTTNSEDVELPSESTESGFLMTRLMEWLRSFVRTKDGGRREDLLHGNPALIDVNEEKLVAFRMEHFRMFLKRTRTEEQRGINLQISLQRAGVAHRRIRVGDKTVNVWVLPEHQVFDPRRSGIELDDDL